MHGDKDVSVYLRQPEHLARLDRKRGLDVILHVERGKGHGCNPSSEAEHKQLLDFLKKHLGVKHRAPPASPGETADR